MTDVQQAAEVSAEVVYVKHKLFTYRVPVLDSGGEPVVVKTRRGVEREKTSIRHAQRFQAINLEDIPEDEYARGQALGAFFSDSEVRAIQSGGTNGNGEASEASSTAIAGLNYDNQDELVSWIQNQHPTVDAVVGAADNDPDKAEALAAAEEEATGGQPRKGVMDGLNRIMQQ